MWVDDETVRKLYRRFNEVGHAHELTFSCFRKLPLLGSDRAREWLVEAIRRAQEIHAFDLWAYVMMPDHVHLIVFLNNVEYSTSAILRSVKQPVAKRAKNYLRANAPDWIQRLAVIGADGRATHQFWQPGGGYDRNITSVDTLWDMIGYIQLNPVRRGLVNNAADWRWSSAAWDAGSHDGPLRMDSPPAH